MSAALQRSYGIQAVQHKITSGNFAPWPTPRLWNVCCYVRFRTLSRLAKCGLYRHPCAGASRTSDFAPMWWLCFERDGRFLGVAIVAGETLSAARLNATVSGVAAGANFTVGHPLDERCRAMLAPEETGRMLSATEAAELAKRFERDAPKKAPATRIRRKPRKATEAEK